MKHLFLLIALLPLTVAAQDCGLEKATDPVTNAPRLSTGFFPLSGNVTLSIDADKKEIDYFFLVKAGMTKCFDEESTIVFLFEGGKQKTQLKNSGSMNCDGIFHVILKNGNYTNTTLQKLSTKKVVSITITAGSSKPIVLLLSGQQQQQLLDKSACMAKEAKTVL